MGVDGTGSAFAGAVESAADGSIEFSEAWTQGRGVYGGVPAAAMVSAMMRRLDRPESTLRSLTVHFCTPLLPGPARIDVDAIRIGGRVAHMASSVVQNGSVTTHSTASFGTARPVSLRWDETSMPKVNPAAELPSVPIELAGGPRFGQFFDYRFAGGPMPMSGSDSARLTTWIRPAGSPVMDTVHTVGVLDAGAPAILSRLHQPRPMASVDFRMQLCVPLPLVNADPNAHWLLDAHARVIDEGYCEQITWLYTPDGQPVGTCQQLIAVLG